MQKKDLNELKQSIKRRYKNGPDNIGKDFISPCLTNSVLYRRGTGFFSSGALANYAEAMQHLIRGETKIEIICSPIIHDKKLIDILEKNSTEEQRISTIQKLSDDIVLNAIGFSIDSSRKDYKNKLLAYLIAKEVLEIRFAIPFNLKTVKFEPDENLSNNLYHVKTGYFLLNDRSLVAFDGSFNESESGHQHHIDQTHVWRSWREEDKERLNDVVEDIDSDWSGGNPYIRVFKISPETLGLIKKSAPQSMPEKPNEPKKPKVETGGLRPYQKEALISWAGSNYRAILALATGTGKTKTAIYAIKEFRKKRNAALVVITVPYIPLAQQWVAELNFQDLPTIEVYESRNDWIHRAQNLLEVHNQAKKISTEIPVFVCVNNSFRGEAFQNLIRRIEGDSQSRLIVVDECHHFNRIDQIKYLPEKFDCRIGLSATPYEPGEQRLLQNYFGENIFEYSIKRAINDGFLAPYEYHPIFIEFTNEEAQAYIKTIKKAKGKNESEENVEDPIGGERHAFEEVDRLLENLAAKLSKLEEMLLQTGITNNTLFYCGQGYVELDTERVRQVELLTRLLFKLGWKAGRITYTEKRAERINILSEFRRNNINAIASIRILDEGIDIPDCDRAFILASQRLVRQGIQRRGRILRKSENKVVAKLFDFIITGPKLSDEELEKLYTKEFERAKLFAADAANQSHCELLLEKI